MRILVFGTLYEPDMGPSAPLFSSLCKEFVQSGHQVTAIVPVPHYPSGRVSQSFRGRLFWHSMEEGVKVIRVGLPSVDRMKLPLRLLQFVCYQLGTAWAILWQQYDVVLAGSPALSGWLPFAVAVVLRRKPAVYSVQDLYPDVGITLGLFRNRFVIAAVSALERFCLQHATIVQTISNSFRPGLRRLRVPDSKISLVYNWVDTGFIRPLPRLNKFSHEHALDERFVVLYAGNMGPSQGLQSVLAAAENLENEKDIFFVLVGDGSAKKALVNDAQNRSLANVLFLPFQPRDLLPEVMASANVSLVPLRKGIELGSLPSKLFTVLASGRPLLACVEKESEMWRLVERANAGLHVPPEDPVALSQAILTIRNNTKLFAQLGQNARTWAERNHSPAVAEEKFEQLLSDAMQRKVRKPSYES
jgi:putative colanic acid biosynthesis glycosyltransferase WcaI